MKRATWNFCSVLANPKAKPPKNRQKRRRVQYQLAHSFNTINEYNEWRNGDELVGWHQKTDLTAKNKY
jgi:hypothetical protein